MTLPYPYREGYKKAIVEKLYLYIPSVKGCKPFIFIFVLFLD